MGAIGLLGDTGSEFLKAFRTISSEKIHVFFVHTDGTVSANIMGRLAEGGRYLILPTMERLFIDPKIYRDPYITKKNYALVFEKNIRCIDITEFGRTREAVKMSHEAYKIYVAKLMDFLKPGSNLLAVILLFLGYMSGIVTGLFIYWALF